MLPVLALAKSAGDFVRVSNRRTEAHRVGPTFRGSVVGQGKRGKRSQLERTREGSVSHGCHLIVAHTHWPGCHMQQKRNPPLVLPVSIRQPFALGS